MQRKKYNTKSTPTVETTPEKNVSLLKNENETSLACEEKVALSGGSQSKNNHKKICDFMDLDFKANLQKYFN